MHHDHILLHEHDVVTLSLPYGLELRIEATHVGELEVERLGGGTLTAVPLTRSIILLLPLPVSSKQRSNTLA